MGYWAETAVCVSLPHDEAELVWGDVPADILDDATETLGELFCEHHIQLIGEVFFRALHDIGEAFLRDWERPPTLAEILAGLRFSGFKPIAEAWLEHQMDSSRRAGVNA